MLAFAILKFVIILIIIVKAADFLEHSFVKFASELNLSPFIVGFTILAFISSLPEVAVALNSSADEVPGLAIGNLIGATLVIMTLIVGLNAIRHKSIPFKGTYTFSYLMISLVLMILMIMSLTDKRITRIEGIILIVAYLFSIILIVRHFASKYQKSNKKHKKIKTLSTFFLSGLAGTIVLIFGADLLVNESLKIANSFGVSNSLIGLIMLGLGTNLPELTLFLRSNDLDKTKLAAGNFIGSATFNVPIMGLIGILIPHQIKNFDSISIALGALFITIIMFGFLSFSNREITKKEGIILVSIYGLWLMTEIIVQIF